MQEPVSGFRRAGQRITALLEGKRRVVSRIFFLHQNFSALQYGIPTRRPWRNVFLLHADLGGAKA